MTAPNPKRQKEAWAKLDRAFIDAENCWVIHYSCESFYERPEGRSPRITSIATRKLDSGQTISVFNSPNCRTAWRSFRRHRAELR
jgi:hypothetical protein